jgi:hypothetical protein
MFRPAVKRIRRVAPRAAKIAARQTHENARQARASAFALNRFENLGDYHGKAVGFLRLLYHSAATRVWRLVVSSRHVNDRSTHDRKFHAAPHQCRPPSPSNREPEKGDQESRDRYDQERSIHVFNVPLGFYGRYVAAVTSVSHTVILETPAPFGTW